MKPLPPNYRERLYAGVLGKIIGVYLGRPFEQWSHEAIEERLGEIRGYVHERLGQNLIVSDDDISGTFRFVRAVAEHGFSPDLTAAQIGDTWLNLIIEEKSILWWGGLGRSTEHTAYLRLKAGMHAPESGSIATNGPIVAEQIGAQIFIDGWGLLNPGDPERAADFARRAASVSHDGEAIYGAQAVAAMVAQGFVEPDVNRLLDTAVSVVPPDCLIRRVHEDVRGWAAVDGDWRATLAKLRERWGYDVYGGGCHMLPNHAVIVLALAYGGSNFDEAMRVVNTAGYDTDCNSGNVGCILGVAGGLDGLAQGFDWRGPVADRMIVPTADGGSVVTDAVQETDALEAMALRLRGLPVPARPARFNFQDRGSVQGFLGEDAEVEHTDAGLRVAGGAAATATWIPAESRGVPGYTIQASPTLWPGQTIVAHLDCPARLFVDVLDGDRLFSDPGSGQVRWRPPVPPTALIERVGLVADAGAETVLRRLDWEGAPEATLAPGGDPGVWVSACSELSFWGGLNLVQNVGTGLALTGCQEWQNLTLRATARANLATSYGVAVRVQGLRRYVAVEALKDGGARVVARYDGRETVLALSDAGGGLSRRIDFEVQVVRDRLEASVGGVALTTALPPEFDHGAIGLVATEGSVGFSELSIAPPR